MPSVLECVWQGCFSEKENSLFFMFWLCFVALSVKYWFVLKCNHCSISIVLSSVWVHKYCFPQLNVSQLTFHGVFFMFTVQKRTYGSQSCCFFFLFFSFFWPSSTQHSALEGCVKLHSWQKVCNPSSFDAGFFVVFFRWDNFKAVVSSTFPIKTHQSITRQYYM